jgi:hypothetical protein
MTRIDRRKFAGALLLGLVACNNSNNGTDAAQTPDLAAVPMDAAASPDLTPACPTGLLFGPQFKSPSDACKACAVTNCCDALTACQNDSACVSFRTCLGMCPGPDVPSCNNACGTANANSKMVTACRNQNCAAECAEFSCVGKVTWAAPTSATATMQFTVADYQSGTAINGATVKACGTSDATCATPLSMQTSDASGMVKLTVPTAPGGIGAYLEITANGYPVHLNYPWLAPDLNPDGANRVIPLVSGSLLPLLASSAGKTIDMTMAQVIFLAVQCVDYNAPGVSVSAGSGTPIYIAGGLPSGTATATDASGAGAVLNVTPATSTTIASTLNGNKYGSVNVVTRAGAVTALNVVPTP